MPGEAILVIDDSLAVQDIAQAALQGAGYRVTTASNGLAALTYPGIEDVDLVIMDHELAGISGEETTRILKQHAPTHAIPVLLLVPEAQMPERESLELKGGAGFLLKPFDCAALVRKVQRLLEQKNLDDLAGQYLSDAADRMMKELADRQISAAVERKTQVIIERCIQNVSTAVDQRARGEIEQKITSLTSDKEQELIKLTVREVAQSMVEKLAERKVQEAMDTILAEQTERAVRRITDQVLPNQIREKTREMLANMLPREAESKLQKAAEKMVHEISEQIIGTVESVANKNVPRAARDLLPPIVETQVRQTLDQAVPRRVAELVGQELDQQMGSKIEPAVRRSASAIKKSVLIYNGLLGGTVCAVLALILWFFFYKMQP